MPKSQKGPEYSREREFKVILEDIQKDFRVFGERQASMQEDLDAVKEKVGHLVEDVTMIKLTMATKKELEQVRSEMATKKDLEHLEKRLIAVEIHR